MSRDFTVKQAERKNTKGRIVISAPSGSGKTSQSLWLAEELAGPEGSIGLIDTERGSAELYSKLPGMKGDGTVFDHIDFGAPYAPLDLVECIEEFGPNYDVLIIDSLSHFWNGPGGILQIVDRITKQKNKLEAWRTATPMQARMIEAILQAPCHVICTTRAKSKMVIDQGKNGKSKSITMSVGSVQREDLVYEFTIALDIDKESHMTTVSKTRMRSIADRSFQTPGDIRKLGKEINQWLSSGSKESLDADREMRESVSEIVKDMESSTNDLTEDNISDNNITSEQLKELQGIFNELPEGPLRNGAKTEFKNAYASPKTISQSEFDMALEDARVIVKQQQAAA